MHFGRNKREYTYGMQVGAYAATCSIDGQDKCIPGAGTYVLPFFSSMQSNFVGFIACSNEVRIKYGPGSKNPGKSGIFFN